MMDPDAGRFIREEEAKIWMTRYSVGEVLKVKGEEFQVLEIRERALILKPLSAQERMLNRLEPEDLLPETRQQRRALERQMRKLAKKEAGDGDEG